MENAIEALEIACVTIMLAMALMVFICLNTASEEGEKYVEKNISREWLIIEGDENYE